jgi:uncharacterized C2H2 Zn-finger protein
VPHHLYLPGYLSTSDELTAMSTEGRAVWDGQYFRCPHCGCAYRLQKSGPRSDHVDEATGLVQCRYCEEWTSLDRALILDSD